MAYKSDMSTPATFAPGTDLAQSVGMPTVLRQPVVFRDHSRAQDVPDGDPIVMPLSLALSLSFSYAMVAWGPTALAQARAACLAAGMSEWSPVEWATFAGTLMTVGGAALVGIKRLLNWFTRLVVERYAELLTKIEANRKATVEVGKQVATGTSHAVTQAAAQAATQVATQATADAVAPAVTKALNDSALPTNDEQLNAFARKVAAEMLKMQQPPPAV